MAATLNRILKKVEDLGDEYFVIHSEIKNMVQNKKIHTR